MSRAPCSPSTEPPAPKGRKPRLRTSTRPNAKGALPASTTGSAPCSVCRGSCVPVFQLRTGHGFPRTSLRKLHPVLNVDSGTPFPQWASCGNGIPLRAPIPGHSFPTAPVSETTSHFEPSDWDALSGRGPKRKLHPTLSVHSGMWLPDGGRCGNRIPFRAFKAGRGFPERVSTTCRRRPGLHRAHRAPACGGGIRARRAWRAPGDGVRAG